MSTQGNLPPDWLNLLLENISDSVIVTDRDGLIRYWNRGAQQTFHFPSEEAIGEHINILYVPTEGEELQEALMLALDGEVITDVEVNEKRKDGGVRTVLLSIVPILGNSGEVEYLATIGKDITIVRDFEHKVLASEKLETVREMMVTLNHKMNQPLTVAGLYLGMLQDEKVCPGPDEQKEYLREIEAQLDSVALLLKKIAEMEEVRTVEYLAENRMVDLDEAETGEDGTP